MHMYDGIWLIHGKNEIMPVAATWINLEIITLSEGSQAKKDKYYLIILTCGI